jgi:hypothetical protein
LQVKSHQWFKSSFGPELWWGANPAVLVKYSRKVGKFDITGIYHEDLDQRSTTQSSFAIPQPQTRRVTLALQRKFGKFGVDFGGIWAGQPLNEELSNCTEMVMYIKTKLIIKTTGVVKLNSLTLVENSTGMHKVLQWD